jgi:hypothetical protein
MAARLGRKVEIVALTGAAVNLFPALPERANPTCQMMVIRGIGRLFRMRRLVHADYRGL